MRVLVYVRMATRRHLARLSSHVFPPKASLYHAMCLIIGASLQERYSLPDDTPTYIQTLLKELDEKEENETDRVD